MTIDEIVMLKKIKTKIEDQAHRAMCTTAYPSRMSIAIDFLIPEWEILVRALDGMNLKVKK